MEARLKLVIPNVPAGAQACSRTPLKMDPTHTRNPNLNHFSSPAENEIHDNFYKICRTKSDKIPFAIRPNLNYTSSRNQLRLADLKPDRWPGRGDTMSDSAIRVAREAPSGQPAVIPLRSCLPTFPIRNRKKPDEIRKSIRNSLRNRRLRHALPFPALRHPPKTSTFLVQRGGGVFIFHLQNRTKPAISGRKPREVSGNSEHRRPECVIFTRHYTDLDFQDFLDCIRDPIRHFLRTNSQTFLDESNFGLRRRVAPYTSPAPKLNEINKTERKCEGTL
jgi:hypothetical protein